MLRALVIGCLSVVLLGAHAVAHAETIALLPLDGEQRLEIYGQPVAREIARALKADGLDVVVVGPKMAVPARAQLIVDGTIKAGKGDSVTLSIRIRDPRDGTTLETLPAATTTLANLDKAASDLSARVVPSVKSQLASLSKPKVIDTAPDTQAPRPPAPTIAPDPAFVVALSMPSSASTSTQLLRSAIDRELTPWLRTHHHSLQTIDPKQLAENRAAPKTVAASGAQAGIALHVLGLSITAGKVPVAYARVRVRIVDADGVKLDRVVRTDTIVGDRNITPDELAARAAREVLAIVHPNVRRTIAGWK